MTARAAVIDLKFEGVGDFASVNEFYNGGTDSMGNSGPNHGISFVSNSLGLVSQLSGGGGNFEDNPTPTTVVFFLEGDGAIMNVAAGFTTGFAFYYSASEGGFIEVYDGLNGTGTVLASIPIGVNYQDHCAPSATMDYCSWDPIGVTFSGTAHSVNFGGVVNVIGIDDITLGSDQAGGGSEDAPEPASLMLLGAGLAGLGLLRRRNRA